MTGDEEKDDKEKERLILFTISLIALHPFVSIEPFNKLSKK